ncbi:MULTISPECIES: tape measure protein [unclassified Methylococcus]|uniref:tape measure protein n=1 Tax=unclassified Methylococcus TaxID=2618889 RepID=UPI003D7E05C7
MTGPIVVGIKLNLDEKGALVGVEKVESGFKRIGSAASESASRIDASYKKVETGIAEVENGFKRVGSAASESAGRIDAAYGKTRQGLDSISTQLATAKRQFLEFITAQAALGAGRELADVADRYANLSARLKLATQSELEYAKAQAQVFAISQRYSTALDDNAKLYSRIAPAVRDAGKSQADLVKVIEAVNASLKTSGASAAEQSSTITQLSQSLASSTVQWEDFGQLADTNMRLVDAVAKQLGGSMGDLKQKMSDGLISNTQLFDAIIAASEQLKAEAATMPNTIGGAMQQIENALARYIGKADQAAGASRDMANAISGVATHFDQIADGAVRAGEVVAVAIGVKAVTAMTAYVAEAAAAANGALLFSRAVGALGGPVGAATFAVLAGAEALSVWRANMIAANDEALKIRSQGNAGALNTTDPTKVIGADLKAKVDQAKQSVGELTVTVNASSAALAAAAETTKKYTATEREDIQSKIRWLEAHGQQADALRLEGALHGFTGKALEAYVKQELDTIAAKKANAEATKAHNKALSEEASAVKKSATEHQNALEASDRFIQSLKDELAMLQDRTGASEAEIAARKASARLTGEEAEARARLARQIKEEIDALEGAERIRQLEIKTQNDIAEAIQRKEEAAARALQSAQDEEQKQLALLAQIQAAHEAGYGPEALARMRAYLSAVYDVTRGMGEEEAAATAAAMAHTEAATHMMDEMTRTGQSMLDDLGGVARSMMSGFSSLFFEPFGAATESMGARFSRVLQQMAAQLMQSAVTRLFTGGLGLVAGGEAGAGGWLGGLLGLGGSVVGADGLITRMPQVGEAMVLPSGSMIINSGGNAVSSFPQYVNYAGTGASVAGYGNGLLGGPGWATAALGYAGAGLGGAGLGYLIGGLIGDRYNYGQAGGAIGGLAGGIGGYAAATSMGLSGAMAGLAATGVGAIAAAVIAVIASQVKVGKPDAQLIANVTPGEGYDITALNSRHGGKTGLFGLLEGLANITFDPADPFHFSRDNSPNKGAWAPGEKFLGDALTALFGPLGKLEESLGVMIPAFQFIGRIHDDRTGIQIPGIYASGPFKFDDNAAQYMQQAVSIATMRLLQQPAVLNQMTDPVTKAVVMLSGDLQAFQANLEKVSEVRKYAGGSFEEVGGRKALGKALDLSGGDIDAYIQNMKELGTLRTFLGEWTPDVGAWTQTVAGFDAMERAAVKFGVSVGKVADQIDKTIEAKQIGIQDKLNNLLGKPQSIQSKLFGANQQFDAIDAEQKGAVADLAKYNKDERQRALNSLSGFEAKTFDKTDRKGVKSMLDKLKDPALASDPAMLAEWEQGWDAFWDNELAQAGKIKNKKKRDAAIANIKSLQQQMDPHAMEQQDVEAARQEYIKQQKQAVLDQAQAYAGQGASQFAAKLKEITDYFSWARDGANELGISVDELNQYQKAATDALKGQFDDALKQFAGESVSGAAAALKAIDDQAKTFREDAIALGKSVEEVDKATEKAKKKLKDDFVHGLEQMAGVLDANTIAFNGLRDQFKGLYEDAITLGVGMDQVGAALLQSMKNLWEQMTSGIEQARQSIAQQIAELRGPQAVADLAGQNVDKAKQKLADYRAGGGTDVNREIALIQAVQSAVMARYQAELALIQETIQQEVEAIQARAQAEIDAVNATLNAQIEAENDRLNAAIEAENDRLNAQIEAINAASQAQIDAIQAQADAAAEARQEAQQAELDALGAQLQTANQLKNAIKGIADYAKSLLTSAESPLSPEARLEAARKQYEETLAKARAGDAEAAARYQQDAEAYRQAAKDYYASSSGYGDVYNRIQADAAALGSTEVTSPDSIESQMKALRKQQAEDNKEAQRLVREQIKAVQQGTQDQIKAAQSASKDYVTQLRKESQTVVEGLRAAAADQIKAIQDAAAQATKDAQDLSKRADVADLKAAAILELQALDANLQAAYDAAVKQYQGFIDALSGVVGANTAAIEALVGWLNAQGVAVTQPQTRDTIIQVNEDGSQTTLQEGNSGKTQYLPPPRHAAGGLARPGWALVGELGPELVNFDRPGRVYTAQDTAKMMAALNAANDAAHERHAGGGPRDIRRLLQADPRALLQELLGGLPSDPARLLAPFLPANDAHGAYANVIYLPHAADAFQSLMARPPASQPPAAPDDRLAGLLESLRSGAGFKGMKEEMGKLRTELRALVTAQSAANPKLLASLQALIARFDDMVSEARLARRA